MHEYKYKKTRSGFTAGLEFWQKKLSFDLRF